MHPQYIQNMSNNIKLSVTILGIPGATRHLVGKSKKKWYITKGDLANKKINYHEASKVLRSGEYTSNDYEYVPCSQRINMTEEAYNEFISNRKPYWFKNPYDWAKRSEEERLELHLARICDSLNGTSFTYSVFDE